MEESMKPRIMMISWRYMLDEKDTHVWEVKLGRVTVTCWGFKKAVEIASNWNMYKEQP
jgi:hypothetical protein